MPYPHIYLTFCTASPTHFSPTLLTFGSAELLQVEVEHGGESIRQLGSQERLSDLHGEVVEHLHRVAAQRQVRPAATTGQVIINSSSPCLLSNSNTKKSRQ